MKQPIRITATLETALRRKDNTLKVVFGTQEMDPYKMAELFTMSNNVGWLMFAPNTTEYDLKVEVPSFDAPSTGKSLSQRLRDVLYLYWKQEHEESFEKFEEFRSWCMEGLIQHYKDKLV